MAGGAPLLYRDVEVDGECGILYFGDMRKEGLVSVTVTILGRRLGWGVLHAVALRVAKMLCTSSRIW